MVLQISISFVHFCATHYLSILSSNWFNSIDTCLHYHMIAKIISYNIMSNYYFGRSLSSKWSLKILKNWCYYAVTITSKLSQSLTFIYNRWWYLAGWYAINPYHVRTFIESIHLVPDITMYTNCPCPNTSINILRKVIN